MRNRFFVLALISATLSLNVNLSTNTAAMLESANEAASEVRGVGASISTNPVLPVLVLGWHLKSQ